MTPRTVPPWAAGFESLSWPAQLDQLRALDNAATGLGGRTAGEAERKRRCLLKHCAALQRVHDAQVRTWIETPARPALPCEDV